MFKRKTKPAHVRKHTHTRTHTSSHWLSRTHPAREKREAEGKNTKDWKHTQSLLSNDTRLEENLDKTRQSGKNWSVWRFDIQAGKQRSGQNRRFFIKSSNRVLHLCFTERRQMVLCETSTTWTRAGPQSNTGCYYKLFLNSHFIYLLFSLLLVLGNVLTVSRRRVVVAPCHMTSCELQVCVCVRERVLFWLSN